MKKIHKAVLFCGIPFCSLALSSNANALTVKYESEYGEFSGNKTENIVKYDGKYNITDGQYQEPNLINGCNEKHFLGWFLDREGKEQFYLTDHTSDLKVYAKYKTLNWCYGYKGAEDIFTVKIPGQYKLETWGAQGGSYNDQFHGGYGAYATGSVNLAANENLFINVGEAGGGQPKVAAPKTYNGGGGTTASTWENQLNTSGGGATHIATVSGVLSTLESHKGPFNISDEVYESNEILLVAAGGGGTHHHSKGQTIAGSGGGILGSNPFAVVLSSDLCTSPTGGSQSVAGLGGCNKEIAFGSFGQGGSYARTDGSYGAGGGGGFYGGGAGYNDNGCAYSGAGGSSYIASPRLAAKHMACFECQTSNKEKTKTITVEKAAALPTEDNAKIGSGYAKISIDTPEYHKVVYKIGNEEYIYYVKDNEPLAQPINSFKEGYTVKNWKNGNSIYGFNTVVTSDLVLTAETELIDYSINYDLKGGEAESNLVTKYNIETENITIPSAIKTGYDFEGWAAGDSKETEKNLVIAKGSTGDIDLVAKYKTVEYSLDYELQGGEAENPDSYTINDTITLNNPTKEDGIFAGWSTEAASLESDDLTKTAVIEEGTTGDITYFAVYKEDYTITFKTLGGYTINSITKKAGEKLGDLPEAKRAGFNFAGWFLDGEPVSADYLPDDDIVLVAAWEPEIEVPNTADSVLYYIALAIISAATFTSISRKSARNRAIKSRK